MEEEHTDKELIQRVAAGDRDALLGLVDRHQASLLRYLRSLTSSPQQAEDALQETLLALWRGAQGYRGDGEVRGWLLGLARRQAARTWRRRAGQPAHFEALDELAIEGDCPGGDALGLAAGWGDPHATAVAHQDLARLRAALHRLSSQDQEILVLRDLEQLSGAQVSALLDLSPAAQKSRLHRARLRLMAQLRPTSEAPRG